MCTLRAARQAPRRAPVQPRPNHRDEWAAQGQATLGQAAEALHGAPGPHVKRQPITSTRSLSLPGGRQIACARG